MTIQGGTLSTDNAGIIETIAPSILDGIGLTISGTLLSTSVTTLKGSITNSGKIQIPGVDSILIHNSGGGVMLDGGGTVALSGGAIANIFNQSPIGRLTNVDNTIKGTGTISSALTNQGTVSADTVGTLTVNAPGPIGPDAGVINSGVLEAKNGGTLVLRLSEFANGGGQVKADGGTVVVKDAASVVGGTVSVMNGSMLELQNNASIVSGIVNIDGALNVKAVGLQNRLSGVVNNNGGILLESGARLTLDSLGTYNNRGVSSSIRAVPPHS